MVPAGRPKSVLRSAAKENCKAVDAVSDESSQYPVS